MPEKLTKQYCRPRKIPRTLTQKSKTALEAKFAAQKLAFAPISFHATKTMRDLGILEEIYNSGNSGISAGDIAVKLKISKYGIETLLEVGAGLDLVEIENDKYTLTKTGFYILFDEMTRVNMDFTSDVCYRGAEFLSESILKEKPVGLKVFGSWETIYQGLSQLPQKVKNSWFAFDHYYSDGAFNDALPIVFKDKPQKIFDIGGNTGKWAISCLNHDSSVQMTILDLAGQLNIAQKNLENLNLDKRSRFCEIDLLNPDSQIPSGANAVWMSQFLDCFSKEQIIDILKKIEKATDLNCQIYILEPFWDRQKYEAAAFSLNHTSLYFTTMANGNSKMYSFEEMKNCIEASGLKLDEVFDDIGSNNYTLLKCSKK